MQETSWELQFGKVTDRKADVIMAAWNAAEAQEETWAILVLEVWNLPNFF